MLFSSVFITETLEMCRHKPGERSEPGRAVEDAVVCWKSARADFQQTTASSTARPGSHISSVSVINTDEKSIKYHMI